METKINNEENVWYLIYEINIDKINNDHKIYHKIHQNNVFVNPNQCRRIDIGCIVKFSKDDIMYDGEIVKLLSTDDQITTEYLQLIVHKAASPNINNSNNNITNMNDKSKKLKMADIHSQTLANDRPKPYHKDFVQLQQQHLPHHQQQLQQKQQQQHHQQQQRADNSHQFLDYIPNNSTTTASSISSNSISSLRSTTQPLLLLLQKLSEFVSTTHSIIDNSTSEYFQQIPTIASVADDRNKITARTAASVTSSSNSSSSIYNDINLDTSSVTNIDYFNLILKKIETQDKKINKLINQNEIISKILYDMHNVNNKTAVATTTNQTFSSSPSAVVPSSNRFEIKRNADNDDDGDDGNNEVITIIEDENYKTDDDQSPLQDITNDKIISDKSSCCDSFTILGKNNTKVPLKVMNNINWKSYSAATRALLTHLFTRDILSTHSLTGKPSPAFLSDKPLKKPLNKLIVSDIVQYVSDKCNIPASIVRNVITVKCADEDKTRKKLTAYKKMKICTENNINT